MQFVRRRRTDIHGDEVADWLKAIEGRLKTLMDAIFDDPGRCKAVKDTVGRMIWQGTTDLLDKKVPLEELDKK